jgi:hypothetical protein
MAKRCPTTESVLLSRNPKADRPFAPGYGIVGAGEGKGLLSWTWVARKMNQCRTFWLATIHAGSVSLHDRETRPHVMPVWGVWLDDAFFFLDRTQIPQRAKSGGQSRVHDCER